MTRDEILARYLHLRAISVRCQEAALECVARPALLEHAKRLGLLERPSTIVASDEELPLVFDLTIHTGKPGRTRPIDRFRLPAAEAADADTIRVRDTVRRTRFSVWRLERWHEQLGVILTDTLRGGETWLVDLGIALSGWPNMEFAARLFWPDTFAMSCGVMVPMDEDLMDEVLFDVAGWLHHTDLAKAADDPRFAAALYRNAILVGALEEVRLTDAQAVAAE